MWCSCHDIIEQIEPIGETLCIIVTWEKWRTHQHVSGQKQKKVCSSWLFGVSCDGVVQLVIDSAFCLNPEKEDSILSS